MMKQYNFPNRTVLPIIILTGKRDTVMSKAKLIKDVNKSFYQNIALNTMLYRRYHQLTQNDLAEMAGISKSFLAAIESPGNIKPCSLETLFDIARALHCDPGQLLASPDTTQKVISSYPYLLSQ